jgi:hypothetical protein
MEAGLKIIWEMERENICSAQLAGQIAVRQGGRYEEILHAYELTLCN